MVAELGQRGGGGPFGAHPHELRAHPPPDRALRVAQDLGGHVPLVGRQALKQSAGQVRRQFVEQLDPVVGIQIGEQLRGLLVLQGEHQVALQAGVENLEHLQRTALGQHPVGDGAFVAVESLQDGHDLTGG